MENRKRINKTDRINTTALCRFQVTPWASPCLGADRRRVLVDLGAGAVVQALVGPFAIVEGESDFEAGPLEGSPFSSTIFGGGGPSAVEKRVP